ncbi:hypothetical protein OCB14_29530 [Bacillus cereus]|uniref:WxL domain-containing protein n=1 Tax=Bacillus cereus TaxID=1396 RepID=A0A9X0SJ11_BACCE|nr:MULTISPECIES: hypothetical protein [Bacillus cereus group]MED1637872.1 hypothetical protein [Bacillus thuringiensis]KXY25963.1 hypothetical protein AT268_14305 [Bacillus cereus]MCU5528523.1 hypothetical protein [Bacillus cereus]MCU5545735.1 hypothetical protein [Bacillus cereus]OUB21137.1 hypothetical protein BK739_32785 [Bacillus thuringiensis serovar pirenaica]
MRVQKKLASIVLLGMMAMGGGVNTFAAEGEYQTIEGQTEANITAKGVIGEADNTDPGEAIPEGDNKWINVTLPTDVVFFSDEKTEHKTIVSPENYKIINNSGRPVKVFLKGFTGKEDTAVKTLNLVSKIEGDFETKELIRDNKIAVTQESELVKLANNEGKLDEKDANKEVSFKFTGNVDETLLGEEKQNVEYKMTLKFKALKMDGTEVE